MGSRIVRLVCLDLVILYLVTRLPLPLLVIPLIGCSVIYNMKEVQEIKNDKTKNTKGKKKSIKKKSKK